MAETPAKTETAAPDTSASVADDQPVITMGSDKITAKQFREFVSGLPEQYRAAAQGPAKRQIAEQMAQVHMMAAEARRRGLDKDPAVSSQIQFSNDNLLAGALYKQMQADLKVDDAALRGEYDKHKNEFEEVQARHILIRFKGSPVGLREGQKELTEEEALAKAQAVRKRIVGGEDFAKVAKEESDDAGSGSAGGDLGSFKKGQMVGEFENAAFSLPVGEVSQPIKTQFGYHIIQVRKHDTKTFEDVKADLEKNYRPQAAREAADALKKGAQYNDAFFGPAPAPAPAAPANAAPTGTAPAPAAAKP